MPVVSDGLGRSVSLPAPATRIVSLVPSATAAVAALGKPSSLVAVTRCCREPAALVAGLRKVGSSTRPDLEAIIALAPDLVLAQQEENRREDVEALTATGLPVYVCAPRSLSGGADELEALARLLGVAADKVVRPLREAISQRQALLQSRAAVRVFCPLRRNPSLAVGGDGYAADLLRLAGGRSVFERHRSGSRHPQVTLDEIVAADSDVVLLPGDPFPFRQRHRVEFLALQSLRAAAAGHVYLIDGRWLTWQGPEVPEGLEGLKGVLERVQPSRRAALPPGLRLTVQAQEVVEESGARR